MYRWCIADWAHAKAYYKRYIISYSRTKIISIEQLTGFGF